MEITFSAANTVGLNNPGTEIITLVKDGSGNFINPPSYDKMRAYLRSGEVPMLFVTTEGGETGSLHQLVEYSETENKIRFSNDKTTIEFSAGASAPVVSDVVPKPLTYDYMPEGFDPNGVANQQFVTDETGAVKWENRQLLIANVTFAENWDQTYPATVQVDKTQEEIYSAATSGKLVYFNVMGKVLPLSRIQGQEEYYILLSPLIGDSYLTLNQAVISYFNGKWEIMVSEVTYVTVHQLNVQGLILQGEDKKRYKITVNGGTIRATELT